MYCRSGCPAASMETLTWASCPLATEGQEKLMDATTEILGYHLLLGRPESSTIYSLLIHPQMAASWAGLQSLGGWQ